MEVVVVVVVMAVSRTAPKADPTDRVWIGCVHFCFPRYGNHGTVLILPLT
jgi:hypothetical protein